MQATAVADAGAAAKKPAKNPKQKPASPLAAPALVRQCTSTPSNHQTATSSSAAKYTVGQPAEMAEPSINCWYVVEIIFDSGSTGPGSIVLSPDPPSGLAPTSRAALATSVSAPTGSMPPPAPEPEARGHEAELGAMRLKITQMEIDKARKAEAESAARAKAKTEERAGEEKEKAKWSRIKRDTLDINETATDIKVAVDKLASVLQTVISGYIGDIPGILRSLKSAALSFGWGSKNSETKKNLVEFENDTFVQMSSTKRRPRRRGCSASDLPRRTRSVCTVN